MIKSSFFSLISDQMEKSSFVSSSSFKEYTINPMKPMEENNKHTEITKPLWSWNPTLPTNAAVAVT